MLLHAHYFDLYRRQVVKQADLLLAQYRFGHSFDDGDKTRNVDCYERRTVRDSSLSAPVQAVTAAEVGPAKPITEPISKRTPLLPCPPQPPGREPTSTEASEGPGQESATGSSALPN